MMSSESLPYHLRAPNIIAVSIGLPIAGALLVATRFRIRKTQKTRVSIDDWLILVALMTVVGMGACLVVGAKTKILGYAGDGEPSFAETARDGRPAAVEMQQSYLAFHLMMLTAYALTKLSILYFLRRLFVVQKKGPFGWITNSLVVVVSLWHVVLLIFFAIVYSTKGKDDEGTASRSFLINLNGEIGMAASDSLLDIAIFILPFPMIWRLQMARGRKAAVSVIFMIGGCAFGASLVRLKVYVDIWRNRGNQAMSENTALTFAMYWAMMEAGFGLIAACLPSLSALFPRRAFAPPKRGPRSAIVQSLRYLQGLLRFQQTQKQLTDNNGPTWESPSMASHAKIVHTPDDVELGAQSFALADIH